MRVLVVGCDQSSEGGIASVVKLFDKASLNSGVSYRYIKTTNYKRSGFLANFLIFLKAFFTFRQLVINVDLVHVQGSSHSSFFRKSIFVVLSRIFSKPVIWNFHASRFEDFFIETSGLSYWYKRWVLQKADRVIVLAERYRALLEDVYGLRNISVLRNPAILNSSTPSFPACRHGRLKVLFIGFFIRNKGVLDLLKFAQLQKENSDYKFYFAGMGDLEAEIKNASERNPDGVELIGWLDEVGKAKAYQEFDVLVLPSYREGMPIVILEAMAAGLPVVATDIAAIPEQIENGVGGLLYCPGDFSGLNRCLEQMKSLEFRKRCSEVGLEKVKNFSVDSVFWDLIQIYRGVLK